MQSFQPILPGAPNPFAKPEFGAGDRPGGSKPRPNPGSYETIVRETSDVVNVDTFGRDFRFLVGNPLHSKFGVVNKICMIGASGHPMMAAPRPPGSKQRRYQFGSYLHGVRLGEDMVTKLEGQVDEDFIVNGVWEQTWSKKLRTTLHARVADTRARSDYTAVATYRGSSYTAGLRAFQTVAGASYMQGLTPNLAVGGEVYGDRARFAKRAEPGARQWWAYSLTAAWNTPEWEAIAQYGGASAGGLLYAYYLQRVSPNVKLAGSLIVRPRDRRSQVTLGGSFKLPRTKSSVKCSVSSFGRVRSIWERRLLSTVRLQCSSEMDFSGNRGMQFGICLQSGFVPQPVRFRTPVLTAWAHEFLV